MLKFIPGNITAARGFRAAAVHCGIKTHNAKKLDLALIVSDNPCAAAGVYTRNKVCGSPVTVTKNHLKNGVCQAIIANSGNANTCNHDGIEKAEAMCRLAAEGLGISPEDVAVASTGVIGQVLPLDRIESGMPELFEKLSTDGGDQAMKAIMTTDLMPKGCAVQVEIGGKTVTLGGIAKGSGMIHPNMATTLNFVTTDAAISSELLQKALSTLVQDTYNMVSVDGDTSTSDMLLVLANGQAENPTITQENEDYALFCEALKALLVDFSRKIAADGEGATKLMTVHVTEACDLLTARRIAKSVVTSSLVKAALFGSDANWGRILCAVGYAEGDFSVENIDVDVESAAGKVEVCRGTYGIEFSEELAKKVLEEKEIIINVNMHDGTAEATAWGCDLTYQYVKINGDYRT